MALEPRDRKPIPSLKGQCPFRVGSPSYIFPDDILPNVRQLAGAMDDIELLLLESDAISPLPDLGVIAELRALASDHSLSYTVHLPLDADIGAGDEEERKKSVAGILRAMARTTSLSPLAYIVHFPAPPDVRRAASRVAWRNALCRSAEALRRAGIDLETLCVENLDYPFDLVADVVDRAGFSVCLDIGHALLHGHPIRPFLEARLDKIRVVHLNGVENGKAHRAISTIDPEVLSLLFSALRDSGDARRVVTLEVFTEILLRDSMNGLAKWMGK